MIMGGITAMQFPGAFEHGPAKLGMEGWEIGPILEDHRTIKATTADGAVVPFAIPMDHAAWHSAAYHTKLAAAVAAQGVELQGERYVWTGADPCWLEPGTIAQQVLTKQLGMLVVEHTLRQPPDVDQLLSSLNTLMGGAYERLILPPLKRDDTLPAPDRQHDATVTHFRVNYQPKQPADLSQQKDWADIARDISNAPRIEAEPSVDVYGSSIPEPVFEALWAMYEGTMQGMSSRHPVGGDLSEQDLRTVIKSDGTLTFIGKGEDGRPNVFTVISSNLTMFDWLNPDAMRTASEGQEALYCLIVVAAPDAPYGASQSIALAVGNTFGGGLGHSVDLWFECPDESAPYIPAIARNGIGRSPLLVPPLRNAVVSELVISYSALVRA